MTEQDPTSSVDNAARKANLSAGPAFSGSWVGRALMFFSGTDRGRYLAAFAALCLVALVLRLWELGGRTMHYDEAIHLYYSWRLSNLEGFVHSPWMHGPFQIELVAAFLKLLGDYDFAARLPYALFGTALVALPYFLRDQIGRTGALLTGLMLALSPSLLYFSRFGRNDIIMVVLAVSLFILLWQYSREPRNRYLYISSALLAIAFASKETAYIIAATFGALALLLSIPFSRAAKRSGNGAEQEPGDEPGDVQVGESSHEPGDVPGDVPVSNESNGQEAASNTEGVAVSPSGFPHGDLFEQDAGRVAATGRFKRLIRLARNLATLKPGPAAGFLALLVTLTLPQWSAGVALARDVGVKLAGLAFGVEAVDRFNSSLGLDLVGREGVGQGIVGAPLWADPFVTLPLTLLLAWIPAVVFLLLIGAFMWAGWRLGGRWSGRAAGLALPLISAGAGLLALTMPLGYGLDLPLAAGLVALAAVAFVYSRLPWKHSLYLVFLPLMASLVFAFLFLINLQVDHVLADLLPEGIQVESSGNALPLNFLVALGVLLTTLTVSLALGLLWKGGVWLVCAGIFYAVWLTLFTTFFTNPVGIFSGAWQGMGYWIAQQEVARGNQPWYYYFVGMSVYEFLPTIFGIIGAAVFIRRRDRLGMALSFWAFVNLLAYTIASEKMPWLLVNITVPFIFLAGKLLGELAERIDWRKAVERQNFPKAGLLLVVPPAAVACALVAAIALTGPGEGPAYLGLAAAVGAAGLCVAAAWLTRKAGPGAGPPLVSVGIAALLLGFTAWTAFQVTYTFDDSRREILVYAQGSQDLRRSYEELSAERFDRPVSADGPESAMIDYDIWYPFQWYARHWEREGYLAFSCFKDEDGAGGCTAPSGELESPVVLVAAHNRPTSSGSMTGYQQSGPRRNLLWFPETYRRPAEDRQNEGPVDEFTQDLSFFGEAATTKENWNEVLNYLALRKLDADWFNSEYYTYRRP